MCSPTRTRRSSTTTSTTLPGSGLEDDGGTYADLSASTTHNATHEWAHPISEVIEAVLDEGLQIELFHEHDYTLFPRWPHLVAEPGGIYRQPEGGPRLPLMYCCALAA